MKQKNVASHIAVKLLLAVLVIVSAVVWGRLLTAELILPRTGENHPFVKAVLYGTEYRADDEKSADKGGDKDKEESVWLQDYPFADDAPASIVAPKKVTRTNEWTQLNNTTRQQWNAFSGVADDFSTKYLPLYDTMTKTTNKLKADIGWDIPAPNSYNPVVFLDDGYLGLCNSRFDYETAEKSLASFKNFTDEQGLPLIYVAAPPKINPSDKNIYGIVDFSNQNMHGLLDAADADGIPCYNLSEEIDRQYSNRHSAYYRTDLHWKVETGLFAAQCIAIRLNADMGWQLSYQLLDDNQFKAEVYPNGLLGSQGRKLTTSVAEPEDISFIYPKYQTSMHIRIPSRDFDRYGDFSLLYDEELLAKIQDGNPDYNRYDPYSAFMRSGNALTRIDNDNADNDIRLLIIHDSFGRTCVPFLSLCVKHIDSIDLRQFDGSLETFIKKEQPYDAVLVLYNPGALGLKSEGKLLFDFR